MCLSTVVSNRRDLLEAKRQQQAMEGLFGQRESSKSPAAMTARVAADARRAFRSRADDVVIDQYVLQAVNEFALDTVRVTTFVPVLALRRVRELLEANPEATLEVAVEA
jgi:hypothetical protein